MFGERLLSLRIELGFTQEQVAEKIGLPLTQQKLSNYEKETVEPDTDTFIKLAKFYNTTVSYIVGDTNNRDSKTKETPEEIAELFAFINANSKDMTLEERKQLAKGIKAFVRASKEEK